MQIPYNVEARPDTGLYNAKLGVWLFLASEVMLFGALFSSEVNLCGNAHHARPSAQGGVEELLHRCFLRALRIPTELDQVACHFAIVLTATR